ncbi:hypothetical protein [Nocardia carnea]|uniref:hypothetical protein n=1 Tax=Nocardia carnea TaxID=37328 RepID=UPI002457A903|nr:hypothetical protein [Nocardia carnea]
MESTDPPEPRRPVSLGEWVARAFAVVLLVPVRLVWEALKLCGRAIVAAGVFVLDRLLVPVSRFVRYRLVRPLWLYLRDVVWGWALQHVLWGMVLTPLGAFLLDRVLRPLRRAVEQWLWRRLIRPALVLVWRWLLRPVLYALAAIAEWFRRWILRPVLYAVAVTGRWLWQWVVVRPLRMLERWVLRPCGILLATIASYGWRGATAVVRVLVVVPCVFVYRHALRPLLRALAVAGAVVVVRPIAWVHRRLVVPMNRAAADLLNTVFGR